MSLNTFEHGIHPSYNKELTAGKGIEKAALPVKVAIPLQQHIGAPCKPLVKKGDAVTEGQKLGEATTFVTAPVHSSISGKVKDIERLPYPGGGKVLSVIIEGDGTDREWDKGSCLAKLLALCNRVTLFDKGLAWRANMLLKGNCNLSRQGCLFYHLACCKFFIIRRMYAVLKCIQTHKGLLK